MIVSSFIDRWLRHLRELRTANGANVTMTFGLAIIPLIGLIGAAVDYSRANSVKVALQAALDSTALMISKEAAILPEGQIQPKADAYFKALFNRPDATSAPVTVTYTTAGGSQIVLKATASIKTNFMGIMGFDTLNVGSSTTAKWGNTRLRVAIVLDNTGSMSSDGKMTALKPATKNLLDNLKAAAVTDGDVYVSMIPFVKDVNVGSSNNGASWIDWTSWMDEPPYIKDVTTPDDKKPSNWHQITAGDSCPFSNTNYGFRCTTGPTNGASNTNYIPSSGTHAGKICPSEDNGSKIPRKKDVYYNGCYDSVLNPAKAITISSGSGASCGSAVHCSCSGSGSSTICKQNYYEHTWFANAKTTWNGCVTDRGNSGAPSVDNYDINVVAPDSTIPASQFAAEEYLSCPQAVMPLNYNWTAMKTLVDNMSPDGNTNQGIGLAHGWMSLVGGGPYPTPPVEDPNYKYSKIIILMSDGLNTENRWYGSQASIDARQAQACVNAKAAGILIYTVQVNTGGDPLQNVLKNCASDPSKFFQLKSANQLVATFQQIGTALSNLRIAK